MKRRAWAAAWMWLVAAAVGAEEVQPIRIVAAHGSVGLQVEVARTEAERARGLMDRATLAPDRGMLFLHEKTQAGDVGFWMYRTLMPLDIAFLDAQGAIRVITTLQPCASNDPVKCPIFTPRLPYRHVLEVNAGYFARHGIGLGDRVELFASAE